MQKQQNSFGHILFNILIPVLILNKGHKYGLDAKASVVIALAFPLFFTIKSLVQNRKFDFIFIDDMMPIIDHFISHDPKHSGYNISPDHSIELVEVARMVKAISGKNNEILITKEGLALEYSGDNSRLRAEMGHLALTPLERSIEVLYHWYKRNKNSLDINKLLIDK